MNQAGAVYMFGYIYVNQKDLSLPDRKTFQSYYCGLCQCLKKYYGVKGQMLLTYDMTFLVILLSGLYELKSKKLEFRCPMHPTKKKTALINEASRYAASMNVLLSYYDLLDDWEDDRAVPQKVMSSAIRRDFHRVRAAYPRQAAAVERYVDGLHRLEVQAEKNLDVIAGLTGEMLGDIFVWKEDVWEEELRCMGFYMGKFIYLMDAYEDLEKDIRKKAYNPLVEALRGDSLRQGASGRGSFDQGKDSETLCKLILTSMMSECARSFERLPILQHAEIIRNALYSGVWAKYEMVHKKRQKKVQKQAQKQEKKAMSEKKAENKRDRQVIERTEKAIKKTKETKAEKNSA